MRATALLTLALIATPFAAGAAEPVSIHREARLDAAGGETFVVFKGRSTSGQPAVTVNGHPVQATGGKRWKARVPIQQLRQWLSPREKVVVTAANDRGTAERNPAMPTGILGQTTRLAALDIRL